MITLEKIFMSWTSKVQKKYQNTQYIYKVHNKEKLLEKIRCTGRFDGIILFWHFLPLNFTSIKKRYYYKSYIVSLHVILYRRTNASWYKKQGSLALIYPVSDELIMSSFTTKVWSPSPLSRTSLHVSLGLMLIVSSYVFLSQWGQLLSLR